MTWIFSPFSSDDDFLGQRQLHMFLLRFEPSVMHRSVSLLRRQYGTLSYRTKQDQPSSLSLHVRTSICPSAAYCSSVFIPMEFILWKTFSLVLIVVVVRDVSK